MTVAFETVRANFAKLTDAEYVTVLGWLLDTAQGDPVDMSDELADDLYPISQAFAQFWPDLQHYVTGEDDRQDLFGNPLNSRAARIASAQFDDAKDWA